MNRLSRANGSLHRAFANKSSLVMTMFSNRHCSIAISVALAGIVSASARGNDGAELKVDAVGYAERIIYHSPETPGYTSWVGLWQLPDGRIRCDFNQLTGPKEKPIVTVPILELRDGGNTWRHAKDAAPPEVLAAKSLYFLTGGIFDASKDACKGMAVLPDGTLVRPVWPPLDKEGSGYVERSTDGGNTWSQKIFFLPAKDYRTWPTLIRPLCDGRLVLFAGCWKRGDHQNGDGDQRNMTKMMFISSDEGKTWSTPIVLMPTQEGVCEESDFCELPNGDLFWVHRAGHYPDHATDRAASPLAAKMGSHPPQSYCYSDRMQSIAYKKGGTFIAGKCEPAPFPHSGYPAVLYAQEGLVLHFATDGIYWTANRGKTWTRLNIPGTSYYPKALQRKDGTILCIGHIGSDDKYGTVDQSIKQQTFRLRVSGLDRR